MPERLDTEASTPPSPRHGPTEVVLLGGGHAHVQMLRRWAAMPPVRSFAQGLPPVSLVSPAGWLTYSGMVPGLVAGHYRAADCKVPLQALADRVGATLRLAMATAIDATTRTITVVDAGGRSEVLRY